MDPETALNQEATWFARSLNGSPQHNLTPEMIYARKVSYRPRLNMREFQCPRCWLRDGLQTSLRAVPGGGDYDLLRCNDDRCGAEFVIPF